MKGRSGLGDQIESGQGREKARRARRGGGTEREERKTKAEEMVQEGARHYRGWGNVVEGGRDTLEVQGVNQKPWGHSG